MPVKGKQKPVRLSDLITEPGKTVLIALDLSLSDTGVCVRTANAKYKFGSFTTQPEKTETYDVERRIASIAFRIQQIIQPFTWSDDIQPFIIIENYAFSKNNAHASLLQELGGVVKNWLYTEEIDFTIISSGTWKKGALGQGHLKKDDIKATVLRKYGVFFKNQNICDAFCMIKHAEKELGLSGFSVPEEV